MNKRAAPDSSISSFKARLARALITAGAALGLAAGLAAPASASVIGGNLLVNGGFEEFDFTGWTLNESSGFTSVQCPGPGPAVAEGFCAAFLSTATSEGTLSQDIATTPGSSYLLSLQYLFDGATPSAFAALVNGTTLFSRVDPLATLGFATATLPFSATAATTTISFVFRNDFGFTTLDAVSVAQLVPEPRGLALLGLGFAALALIGRRRSR